MEVTQEGAGSVVPDPCEQDGTPRGGHRPTSSERQALQKPVTPGNWHHEKLPGLFTEGPRPLCPGGPAAPASLLRGLCQAGSPSGPTLHGGFVKNTIRHSEETTQLPPSPQRTKLPLCVPVTSPLPGSLPLFSCLPRGSGEAGAPALWEPRGRRANELSPAGGRALCT